MSTTNNVNSSFLSSLLLNSLHDRSGSETCHAGMDSLTYCPASMDHLPQILEIEKENFPLPWDIFTFTPTMEDRRCEGIVAVENRLIVGYCFAIHQDNMVRVLKLAVRKSIQRKGIATRLLQKVLLSAALKNRMLAYLEVRMSNVTAITFYSKIGFIHASTLHRYYPDNNEDASVMAKDLRVLAMLITNNRLFRVLVEKQDIG